MHYRFTYTGEGTIHIIGNFCIMSLPTNARAGYCELYWLWLRYYFGLLLRTILYKVTSLTYYGQRSCFFRWGWLCQIPLPIMPSSHLLRTPCDKCVYDFPCDFWVIVGGYGPTAYVFTLSTGIVQFYLRGLGGNPGLIRTETVRRLYGNRAMSVQLPSSLPSLRTEIVRNPCEDRPSHDARVGIVAMPPTTCLRAMVLRFFSKFVKLLVKPNRRGGAAEPVNPYENLTVASCLRREASRRPHGKGDTAGYGLRRPIASQMWTRH